MWQHAHSASPPPPPPPPTHTHTVNTSNASLSTQSNKSNLHNLRLLQASSVNTLARGRAQTCCACTYTHKLSARAASIDLHPHRDPVCGTSPNQHPNKENPHTPCALNPRWTLVTAALNSGHSRRTQRTDAARQSPIKLADDNEVQAPTDWQCHRHVAAVSARAGGRSKLGSRTKQRLHPRKWYNWQTVGWRERGFSPRHWTVLMPWVNSFCLIGGVGGVGNGKGWILLNQSYS